MSALVKCPELDTVDDMGTVACHFNVTRQPDLGVQQIECNCNLHWQAPQLVQADTQVHHTISVH